MPRNRTYVASEVETLFRASEGAAAPSNGRPGHAAGQHIVLSNAELVRRYRAMDRDEAPTLVSAFAIGPQAITAVTEALATRPGQAALDHLEKDCVEGDRVTIQAVVSPFQARYAFGPEAGSVRGASMSAVTVVLERREGSVAFGLHLVTAFPAFEFRPGDENNPGRAGWKNKSGNWASG